MTMTRYLFDIHNDGLDHEPVPMELSSREDVVREAGRILADMARDEMRGSRQMSIFLNVRDETGRPVFVSSLSFMAEWLEKDG